MATYNKFEVFVEDLASGSHSLPSDVICVYLSNDAPTGSSDTVKADVTEIATGNGYTGRMEVSGSLSRTGGTVSFIANEDPIVITATGAVGPFQYVVAFNTSSAAKAGPLISWWDYGSEVTLANNETFTMDFAASVFTIA